ncbi:DUF4189 domain-containing protein [Oceanidesulfovibrio marinus]|uniref:DUF4189 domain-containing protein n=2 Tax=Oceanidesulfovibrio marinus TaxID=370038 RepID=A0ABX6NED9_9BACT|nr:DUF4189 domain-containing protein [Oceanidesulfovibrio marinus]
MDTRRHCAIVAAPGGAMHISIFRAAAPILAAAIFLVLILVSGSAQADQRWTYEPPRNFQADEAANIRKAPDLGSEILGSVARGQTMQVTARMGDFYEVPLIMGGVGYIHRLYLTPLGLLTTPAPPQEQPETRWQAMAYSPRSGSLGSAFNQYTLENAWNAALNACGRQDCRVTVNSEGGCVSMSQGSGNTVGFGSGAEGSVAERAARQDCKDRGGRGCSNVRTVCQR